MRYFNITMDMIGTRVSDDTPSVLVIGNLDGIHTGHAALIETARKLAEKHNGSLGVVSFSPHPRLVFQPDAPPFQLATQATKQARLKTLGVDCLYDLHFDRKTASLSAIDFIKQCLVNTIGCAHIVVGEDFHFGKNRLGNVEILHRAGAAYGFQVHPQILTQDAATQVISSSRIREMIRNGDIRNANTLLGWDWSFSAKIQNVENHSDDILAVTLEKTDPHMVVPLNTGYDAYIHSEHAKQQERVFILHNTPDFVKLFCNAQRFTAFWGEERVLNIALIRNARTKAINNRAISWIENHTKEQDNS